MPNEVRHLSERFLAGLILSESETLGMTHKKNLLQLSLEPFFEFDVEAEGAVLVAQGHNGNVATH